MRRVHIVGRQNHGKTTLLVELIQEFVKRGVAVGAIKHSKHFHELDTPGKDSHRLRAAGAAPAAVASAGLISIFVPRQEDEDFYERLEPLFADCRLVLVEGHMESEAPKLEVWRAAIGGPCLASERPGIVAVISDDQPTVAVQVWSRSDVASLADHLLDLAR